jgi:hypothetical protein
MTQPALFEDVAIRRVMHNGEWHFAGMREDAGRRHDLAA